MRRLGLVVLIAIAISLSVVGGVAADVCGRRGCPPPPETLPNGYRYSYSNGSFVGGVPPRQVTKNSAGTPIEVFYQPACDGNVVDASGNGPGVMCARAVLLCRASGGVMMFIFTRLVGDTTAPARHGEKCMNPPIIIPLGDVQAALIRQLRERHLPQPTLSVAPPGGKGLVNFPQVFWTQDVPPVTLDVTIPVPAHLMATASYDWDFGDGAHGPDDPGTPYRPGVLPKDNPGFYVDHTFSVAGPVSPSVTVSWHATFRVPGINQTFDVPAITLRATTPLTLYESRSQLVAGEG